MRESVSTPSSPEPGQAVKTVATHLGHAYRKLDVTSRRQLSEALTTQA